MEEDDLKTKFTTKETPNLQDVPKELVPILQKCFSYKLEDRPTTFEIFHQIRGKWLLMLDFENNIRLHTSKLFFFFLNPVHLYLSFLCIIF